MAEPPKEKVVQTVPKIDLYVINLSFRHLLIYILNTKLQSTSLLKLYTFIRKSSLRCLSVFLYLPGALSLLALLALQLLHFFLSRSIPNIQHLLCVLRHETFLVRFFHPLFPSRWWQSGPADLLLKMRDRFRQNLYDSLGFNELLRKNLSKYCQNLKMYVNK